MAVEERFDEYVDRCLYQPDGFYASTGFAGRRGDFITSPETGPLFGAVLARALDQWWNDAGRPEPFRIFDVGCGPGTLLKSIRRAAPDRGWDLIGVDRAQPFQQADTVIAELPDSLDDAVVIGNELLDNMPFRVLQRDRSTDSGWLEVFVRHDSLTQAVEVLRPFEAGTGSPTVDELVERPDLQELSDGARIPVHAQARHWVDDVLSRSPLKLCLFDYGLPTTLALAQRGGWLRTYRQHERSFDPYDQPGQLDITTDVGFDQLPKPESLSTQRDFLRQWGIDELVAEGKAVWSAKAHAPDVDALAMRSRVAESEALLDTDGLGDWLVGTW